MQRNLQLQQLVRVMENRAIARHGVFLSGLPSTGKTTALEKALEGATMVAAVDCNEAFTLRLFMEQILNQLSGIVPSVDNNYSSVKCLDLAEFVHLLTETLTVRQDGAIIVLDHVEALMDLNCPTLLPLLLKLPELTNNVNVTVMMVSNRPWDDFIAYSSSLCPIMIHFPAYTRDEALSIIADLDCPPEESKDFFRMFVDLIYTVFHVPCRHLGELRHVVALLFPKFVEPVRLGKATKTQTSKLFGLVQSHIKDALHSLYLREISTLEWEKRHSLGDESLVHPTGALRMFDLPFYTKFILIASFLASYNPPRLDQRFFGKGREDKKQRITKKGSVNNGSKLRQQLLGPKAFLVERMLAIFYSIIDDQVDAGFNVHSQISTLVSLRLLVRATQLDNLDAAKCKCNASFAFVRHVGRSVRFDLAKYLFDFVDQ